MAKKAWKVPIPQGYYISWFITTQAANSVTVILKDEFTTYFSANKQSMSIDPPLALGSGFVDGVNLDLIVDVPASLTLLGTPVSSDIFTEEGIVVGKIYNICIEDSNDKDYNDVSVNIVGWKNKG